MSTLSHKDREEMNALSKEVFGSTSRWQKLINKGRNEVVTREVEEVVPGVDGAPDTTQKVRVPEKRGDIVVSALKRHTTESIKEFMLQVKVQFDAMKAQMERLQKEQEKAKALEALTEQAKQQLSGSANIA